MAIAQMTDSGNSGADRMIPSPSASFSQPWPRIYRFISDSDGDGQWWPSLLRGGGGACWALVGQQSRLPTVASMCHHCSQQWGDVRADNLLQKGYSDTATAASPRVSPFRKVTAADHSKIATPHIEADFETHPISAQEAFQLVVGTLQVGPQHAAEPELLRVTCHLPIHLISHRPSVPCVTQDLVTLELDVSTPPCPGVGPYVSRGGVLAWY
jgi:hypothetical protein